MFQLVYASSAIHEMTEPELLEILSQSSRNNLRRGITGLLLYHDGCFIGLLEGERDVVEATYAEIVHDTRHHGFTLLLDTEADERLFDTWAMSFRRVSDPATLELPEFSPFMREPALPAEQRVKLKPPMVLLDMFRWSSLQASIERWNTPSCASRAFQSIQSKSTI